MGRRKLNTKPVITEEETTDLEMEIYDLKNFLAKNYPDILDEYECNGVIYG
jgi:hypothetical protein